MHTLYFIFETYSNGLIIGGLDLISIFAILCAMLVIISKNPIVSVLFLIGLFGSISCYLISIGLTFIGLSYLIVYIGAVSILFLFILMLINIRISELQSNTSNSIPLAIAIAISFYYPISQILPDSIVIWFSSNIMDKIKNYSSFLEGDIFKTKYLNTDKNIFYVTTKMWDGYMIEYSHITSLGNIMYTNYNIWLIISSYILLLAMVGSIIITVKQRN